MTNHPRMRWAVNIAGWMFGLIVSVALTVPWIAEAFHQAHPPYTVPTEVAFVCDGDNVIITAKARKVGDFYVPANGTPGYLLIHYTQDNRVFPVTAPLLKPDGEVVPTKPTVPTGDEFVVGPFRFHAPEKRNGWLAVSVVLHGYRYVIATIGDSEAPAAADEAPKAPEPWIIGHKTKAFIGPMMIPPC